MKKEDCRIISQAEIAENIFEIVLEGGLVQEMHQPGQFVHIKVSGGLDPMLRRPLSIAAIDRDKGRFTLVFRKQGRGTSILSEKTPGDMVDVLGPLGNGFPVWEAAEGNTALLVGGGIGVPPLYELGRRLAEKGVKVVSVLGFQTSATVFYQQKFAALGEVRIATADGSYGRKGFVTAILDEMEKADVLYSCGPSPMLRAISSGSYADKMFVSLEERMGCGIGACFACVCKSLEGEEGSYKKICTDGPVFRAGEVAI